MTTIQFGSNLIISDTFTGVGSQLTQTSTNTCVIGGNVNNDGIDNVIIGNGCDMSDSASRSVIIGNNASCSASETILIGNDSSTIHSSVCQLGGQTTGTAISDYGRGHFFIMPPTDYTTNATITVAAIQQGFIRGEFTTDCTLYFPDAATIQSAMKSPVIGSGYHIYIHNNSTGTYQMQILASATGIDYKGLSVIPQGRGGHFFITCTNISSGTEAVLIRSGYDRWR